MARQASSVPLYPRISPKAYEHPADRAATAALKSIPLLDRVLKKLSEFGFERSFQQLLLADAIRVGEHQLPELYEQHHAALDSLDIDRPVALYVSSAAAGPAMTVGSARPMEILAPATLRALEEKERLAVLAHEAGHVLSDHVHYRTVLAIVQRLLSTGRSPIGRLPLEAVSLVLLEWYRAAELSSDRAAALVCGDITPILSSLMKLAGGGAEGLNLEAFLEQAREFSETDDVLARPGRFLTELTRTHPYTVRRAAELQRWVGEGAMAPILRGDYVRIGEEPPQGENLRAATEHYRQRFMEVLERAAGGAQHLAEQLSSWLRSDRPSQ